MPSFSNFPAMNLSVLLIASAMVAFENYRRKIKVRSGIVLVMENLLFTLLLTLPLFLIMMSLQPNNNSGYGNDDQTLYMVKVLILCAFIMVQLTGLLAGFDVCPAWCGEDLHNLVASNIDKLGNFLEGFGDEYFGTPENGQADTDRSFLQGYSYKSVRDSKKDEEALAYFATWEPAHGRFKFHHPWKQYLKIGELTRKFAHKIQLLDFELYYKNQSQMEMLGKIKEICIEISSEAGKAMRELASSIKTMTTSSSALHHIANSKHAVEIIMSPQIGEEFRNAFMVRQLIDVVKCTEDIYEAVQELASLADFKREDTKIIPEQQHLLHRGTMQPISVGLHHIITIDGPSAVAPIVGGQLRV